MRGQLFCCNKHLHSLSSVYTLMTTFGALTILTSPWANRAAMQQVKNVLPIVAAQQHKLYLDAAVGMHPDVDKTDQGVTPQVASLSGIDVIRFLETTYEVKPDTLNGVKALTVPVMKQLAEIDAGMQQFLSDVQTYLNHRQTQQYQQSNEPIVQKIFNYTKNALQQGCDANGKPIIRYEI